MNVLNQSNRDILFLLGKNPFIRDKKYRLNKYCFIHNYEGVKLILNEMTRSMVSMTEEEFGRIYEIENVYVDPSLEYVEYMIENYFLVLEDYDEAKETDKIREHLRPIIDDNYLKECYDFVIYPTTTCNARCFYCYEKPMKKMPMSIEMAERVSKYIMKKSPNKEKTVILRWFGGEPLFNMKVMRYIMNSLKANGYDISSSIISNGYLFDDAIVKEAIEEWKLNHVQITLDGTEEVYNKAKNYLYKNQDEVSPFKKVIENIDKLTSNGVNISIRMNTDMYNVEDLKVLVKYLHERFPSHENLSVYCYPIFEDLEKPKTNQERKELFDKLFELEEVMDEYGFIDRNEGINGHIRITHCMVDNGNTINIHPDGTLGLCEHYIDSDFWGYIDENSNEVRNDWEKVLEWRTYLTDERCKNCPIYPTCLRVKKCSDLKECHEYFQEFRLKHEKENMEGVYNGYIKRLNGEVSCKVPNGGCYCISQRCDGNEQVNSTQDGCYCVSQRCGDNEQINTIQDGCYCISQRCDGNEQVNSTQDGCYCVSQRCEDKENWCYCISKKEDTKEHKCEGGSCTCKKEEHETSEEQPKKKSLWEKIKDIF